MGQIIYLRGGDAMERKASIFDVADYFLSQVDTECGSVMTSLKLQKMCFYAQAWHLVWHNEPLFEEEFEAWAHGPANPELYRKYKNQPYYQLSQSEDFTDSIFTADQKETLDAVWDAYGMYDAKFLELKTHEEDPWIEARGNIGSMEKCTSIISKKSMKEFYSKYLE